MKTEKLENCYKHFQNLLGCEPTEPNFSKQFYSIEIDDLLKTNTNKRTENNSIKT